MSSVNEADESMVGCRRCGFFIARDATRCECCGAGLPGRWLPTAIDRGLRARLAGMGAGGVVGAGLAAWTAAAALGDGLGLPPLVAAAAFWLIGTTGALAGLSVGALFGGWLDDALFHPSGPRPLQAIEARLRARDAELAATELHIAASSKRIAARLDGTHRDRALEALQTAGAATTAQRRRYAVELLRVELLRLRNRLRWIETGWQTATHASCEQRLTALAAASRSLEALTARVAGCGLDGAVFERFLARLEATTAGCDGLRRTLLLRQAAALTAAAPGIDSAFEADARLPAHFDDHDAESERSEFHRLFDVLPLLEREGDRLRAELAALDEVDA